MPSKKTSSQQQKAHKSSHTGPKQTTAQKLQKAVQAAFQNKPGKHDFTSELIAKVADEAGLWQMSALRVKSLMSSRKTFLGTLKPKSTDIRIKAIKGLNETSGVSADENVRTQVQRDKRAQMTTDEASMAFAQRSHQGVLVWKTDSPSLSQYGVSTDTSEPLAAHTPGVKRNQLPGTSGAITKEHGTRDNVRQSAVLTTIADPKREESDIAIMGKLATLQLFTSPREELQQIKSTVSGNTTNPVYSVFQDIGQISGPSRQKNFEEFVERVHTARETDKMHTAKMMLTSGREHLVPEVYKNILSHTQGDVGKAMNVLHEQSTSTTPVITFNTATHSQTDRLDQQSLREMNTQAQNPTITTRPRVLSNPRSITRPTVDLS